MLSRPSDVSTLTACFLNVQRLVGMRGQKRIVPCLGRGLNDGLGIVENSQGVVDRGEGYEGHRSEPRQWSMRAYLKRL